MEKRFDELYEQLLNEFVYKVDDNKGRDVIYTAPEPNGTMYIMRILQAIENNGHHIEEINELSRNPTNTTKFRQDLSNFFAKVKAEDETGELQDIPDTVWDSLVNYAFSRIAGPDMDDATLPAWKGAPSNIKMVDAFDNLMAKRVASGADPADKNQQIIPFAAYIKNYTGQAGGGGLNNLFGPDKE